MQPDIRRFLYDIRLASEALIEFAHDRSLDNYQEDLLLRSAVERQFEIIGEALKNICRAANLVYKVETHAVVMAHKDFPISKMETRIYPVDPDAYQIIKNRLGK